MRLAALRDRLNEPVSGASLNALRIGFGALMAFSAVRFVAEGWVERFYGEPTWFFTYYGFDFVRPLPVAGMYALYVAMAALGVAIAVGGRLYRPALAAFVLVFSYVELIDVTNYLNHYYLVTLLGLLLLVVPAHRPTVPRWAVWLLRFQIGVVYTFAALAKAGPDWLIHAQPLNIWMSARTETPVIGPLLDLWWVALVMSWAGFLNDLLAPWLLAWRRTRPWMFAVIVVFHGFTGVFFQIGIFPILMVMGATTFFAPDWPRRLRDRWRRWRGTASRVETSPTTRNPPIAPVAPLGRFGLVAIAVWMAVQVVVPLRGWAYGGDVNWHEQGMRWSWRVMCREKNGAITYAVHFDGDRRHLVYPSRYLTPHQEREFSGQPDMILQLAHQIGADYRAAGHDDVEVRVDALVSLNGRPPAPMIDPTVDLMEIRRGLARADWILAPPPGPPIRLTPSRTSPTAALTGTP